MKFFKLFPSHRLSKLNFSQRIIIIVLILATLYTGTYIYEQYRLTVEHNLNIQKWCMIHAKDFHGKNSNEKLNLCKKYFGKYHLPFKREDLKRESF